MGSITPTETERLAAIYTRLIKLARGEDSTVAVSGTGVAARIRAEFKELLSAASMIRRASSFRSSELPDRVEGIDPQPHAGHIAAGDVAGLARRGTGRAR